MNGSKPQPAEVISKPPQVTFDAHVVSPPNTIYVSSTMRAVVAYMSNTTGIPIDIVIRILKADGTLAITTRRVLAAAANAAQAENIALTEGFLVSVSAVATQSGFGQQSFVGIYLEYASISQADVLQVLVQGSLLAGEYLAWPHKAENLQRAGQGGIRAITGTNPGASAEISETVPTNAKWRLCSFTATLVTDATVAARVPTLAIDDGANVYARFVTPLSQAASLTRVHSWVPGGFDTQDGLSAYQHTLGTGLFLLPGHRIRTITGALQAGDDWGAPVYLVEEWLGIV